MQNRAKVEEKMVCPPFHSEFCCWHEENGEKLELLNVPKVIQPVNLKHCTMAGWLVVIRLEIVTCCIRTIAKPNGSEVPF